MYMKRFILAAFTAGLYILATPNSYACSCTIPEPAQAFEKARAVFVGEVTEIVKPRTASPKAPLGNRLYAVKFKVEKSWKGLESQEIIVLSDQGRAGCFSWGSFFKGAKYLVWADEAQGGRLAVLFSCNRTTLLTNASEDLKYLDAITKPTFKFNRKPLFDIGGFAHGAHDMRPEIDLSNIPRVWIKHYEQNLTNLFDASDSLHTTLP